MLQVYNLEVRVNGVPYSVGVLAMSPSAATEEYLMTNPTHSVGH